MKGAEPIFINKNSKVGVLMLHGFTSTPYQFRELSDYLSKKGFTVYAPLIAGHGTSPEQMIKTTSKDWCDSVKEAYFKLKKKASGVVVIGNSFGGNLAFWLAKELNNNLIGIISLGSPVKLRYHKIITLRYNLYGRFRKYYRKPMRVYKTDYTDMMDEVTYPVIPVKCLGYFLDFLENETSLNLDKVKVPVLVVQPNDDPVVHPKSATYIYENLGSSFKKIYWLDSKCHVVTNDKMNTELFDKIHHFIKELISNGKKYE